MHWLLLVTLLSFNPVQAEIFSLEPGESIQETIDIAQDGDFINLSAGTYKGNIDFQGKAITIVGVGRASIIKGTNSDPVVSFVNNETLSTLLDKVTVTGGKGSGGILIRDASPRINRSWIVHNKTNRLRASAITIINNGAGASPAFFNNVIARNGRTRKVARIAKADGQIEITDASANFINNTIIGSKMNNIIINGSGSSRFSNNIIGFSKNYGILMNTKDGDASRIDYNLFFANKRGDLKLNESKHKNIEEVVLIPESSFTITTNIKANPLFRKLKALRNLRLKANSPAIDTGDPDSIHNDFNGTRNDIGASGGLFFNPDLD